MRHSLLPRCPAATARLGGGGVGWSWRRGGLAPTSPLPCIRRGGGGAPTRRVARCPVRSPPRARRARPGGPRVCQGARCCHGAVRRRALAPGPARSCPAPDVEWVGRHRSRRATGQRSAGDGAVFPGRRDSESPADSVIDCNDGEDYRHCWSRVAAGPCEDHGPCICGLVRPVPADSEERCIEASRSCSRVGSSPLGVVLLRGFCRFAIQLALVHLE
jgi:hypothetical protein